VVEGLCCLEGACFDRLIQQALSEELESALELGLERGQERVVEA
jgi:hypothetical protein